MTIERATFDDASAETLADHLETDEVLGLLTAHDDRAFTLTEIATELDLDVAVVSTTLRHLAEMSLVDVKGKYWAVTADYTRLYVHDDYSTTEDASMEPFDEDDPAAEETLPIGHPGPVA